MMFFKQHFRLLVVSIPYFSNFLVEAPSLHGDDPFHLLAKDQGHQDVSHHQPVVPDICMKGLVVSTQDL